MIARASENFDAGNFRAALKFSNAFAYIINDLDFCGENKPLKQYAVQDPPEDDERQDAWLDRSFSKRLVRIRISAQKVDEHHAHQAEGQPGQA